MDRARQRRIEARERRLNSLKTQFGSVAEKEDTEVQASVEVVEKPHRGRKKNMNLEGTEKSVTAKGKE